MATHTASGTPCARTWSESWIAAVNATETQLNHRICGSRLPDGTPCTNDSDHASGRCKFHGGFDLTGAPKGNRNHVIHGLYTRRLRTCSQTCPFWNTCPIAKASPDSSTGSTGSTPSMSVHVSPCSSDPSDRSEPSDKSDPPKNPQSQIRNPQLALCPYQLTEYNTVLTDALAVVESQPHPNPMGLHAAHNVAMLQVLVSNAMTHVANTDLFSHTDPGSNRNDPRTNPDSLPHPKPQTPDPLNLPHKTRERNSDITGFQTLNPSAVNAFFRLMREFRASLKLLYIQPQTPLNRQKYNAAPPTPEGILRHAQRTQFDTGLDPDSLADANLEPQTAQTHAKAFVQQAALAGGEGREIEMCETFDNATMLDEPYAKSERDHVLASYRPKNQGVSEEMAERILGNLHLPPLPEQENEDSTDPNDPIDDATRERESDVLQRYLDLFRDGKIPPEAFPLNTPIRAYAETIYTGPPLIGAQSKPAADS